ncbi:hypothetical protein ABPG74_004531 [Tetrahymena malaccensis]
MNKCKLVRDSCSKVLQNAKHAKINQEKLKEFGNNLLQEFKNGYKYIEFDEYSCHYNEFKSPESIVDYIFVLDTLNFCFWPCEVEFEYDDLAAGVKSIIIENPELLKPKNIINIERDFVKQKIFKGIEFPLLDERVRLLKEIGVRTLEYFDGEFVNVVKRANHSAVKMLDLLSSFYNNFQDVAIYRGEQICFYKRSQIMIGDLYGAFKGKDYGRFDDIEEVTTFPDYRVPQILNHYDVIQYSEELTNIIESKIEIPHGGEYEVEIRAATVHSVEELKKYLKEQGKSLHSIEVDWILWQKGEEARKNIKNHHRVLSIFY